MRVELTTDGGFADIPGLAAPMVVDSAHLAAEEAAQLQRLCDAASAAAMQPATPPASPNPDGRRYHLTIETAESPPELTRTDPSTHPAIAQKRAVVQQGGQRGRDRSEAAINGERRVRDAGGSHPVGHGHVQ
jgi:hypothetical protein